MGKKKHKKKNKKAVCGHEYLLSQDVDAQSYIRLLPKMTIEDKKMTKRERKYIEKYGHSSVLGWNLDSSIPLMIMEMIAGFQKRATIVDWEFEDTRSRYDIQVWDDEKEEVVTRADVPLSECLVIVQEYLSVYVKDHFDHIKGYQILAKKLELGFAILGKVLPVLWW